MHGAVGGSGLTMETLNMLLSPTTHHYDSSMWLSLIMNIENQYYFEYWRVGVSAFLFVFYMWMMFFLLSDVSLFVSRRMMVNIC